MPKHGNDDKVQGGGPTYVLDLDGTAYEWRESTISVPDIRDLAGWPADQEIVLIDLRTNDERTLAEDAIVDLKPGHGFGRKFKFRRGSS